MFMLHCIIIKKIIKFTQEMTVYFYRLFLLIINSRNIYSIITSCNNNNFLRSLKIFSNAVNS